MTMAKKKKKSSGGRKKATPNVPRAGIKNKGSRYCGGGKKSK